MKPMIALIVTGIVLLLIMLYFGTSSFEGTFETNVYQNSIKYNKTSKYIIELGKDITNVTLKYDIANNVTMLSYNFSKGDDSTYTTAEIKAIELTYPNKADITPFVFDEQHNCYVLNNKLNSSFYTIIFHITLNNQYDVKVLKTVYFE